MPWSPERPEPAPPVAQPPVGAMLSRGLKGRCPVCGEGRLFQGYLRLTPECSGCGTPLGRIRADDAPPYFTILLAGHVLVPIALLVERTWQPPVWVHMLLWLPLFTLVTALLLRPVKGMVVAWMLRLGLNGDEQGAPVPAAPRRGAHDA